MLASVIVLCTLVMLLLCCGRLVSVPVSTLLTRTTSPRLVQRRHREGRRGAQEVWRGKKEGGLLQPCHHPGLVAEANTNTYIWGMQVVVRQRVVIGCVLRVCSISVGPSRQCQKINALRCEYYHLVTCPLSLPPLRIPL